VRSVHPQRTLLALGVTGLLATAPAAWADLASELLVTTAPTALTVKCPEEVGLEIHAGPVRALTGCRAYLASRGLGARAWTEETVAYRVVAEEANRLDLEADFERCKARVVLRREAGGRYELSGRIENTSSAPLELARFHYLDGRVQDPTLNLLSMRQFELPGRLIKPSETLPAPRQACQKGWGSVHWPRLSEPIHDQPNVAISGDTGMLAPDWNSPGFFLGFTGPGSAFGELGMRIGRSPASFFVAVLLDAIRLDPADARTLERAILSFGDPQDELRHWAVTCGEVLGPVRVRPPLVGYCSWYQQGQGVQPSDLRRALRGFTPFPAPPGGRTIQVDDGYQVCPGDWTGRGEWRTALSTFPAELSGAGFIPGLWIAPTAIHASHPIVKEHPDWLQRDASNQFCIRFHNWRQFNGRTNAETYFLEPDHPEARRFIADTLRRLRTHGWRYFKIDFAYTVSSDRVKYDPRKTTYESLRDQWRLFREALGEEALINSCNGGIWRYTLGAVDISRIGGDIGSSPKHLHRNLAEMMVRSHVNGVWFQADPDVFYLRAEMSDLSFEQSHLLTGTQGLLGTAFLTSDFADQWSAAARAIAHRYWNASGPRVPLRQRLVLRPDGLPSAIGVAYGRGDYAVGLYNWGPEAGDITVSLKDLGLPAGTAYSASAAFAMPEKVALTEGRLTVFLQPADSLRIIRLEAAMNP
jgi:hypothetical protein